jgi:hypothetical protein
LAEIPKFEHARISSGLSSIMVKCLQAKKDHRYQNMRDLLADLDALQNNFIPSAEEAHFVHHCKMLYKRNRQTCHLLIASLVVLFFFSLFYVRQIKESRSKALVAKSEAISSKKQAESYLKQIINEQKQNEQLSIALSPRYLNIAQEHWHFYELNKAIEYCDLALKVDPNNTEAKNMRAKLHIVYGEYHEAHKLWKTLNYNKDEAKLNNYLLKNDDPNSIPKKILNFKGNSSPMKILKSRALFHLFEQSHKVDLLKEIILISNPKLKQLKFDYLNNSFSAENNDQFINNNFLRPLKIQSLNLQGTRINDISSLNGKSFDFLNLSHTPLWNLAPLKESHINKLDISFTYIDGLWNLEQCQLKKLYVNNTKINTIPDEIMLTIEVLDIKKTQIKELTSPSAPHLHWLNIAYNNIKNLGLLESYPKLQTLTVHTGQLNSNLMKKLTEKGVNLIQLSSSSKR